MWWKVVLLVLVLMLLFFIGGLYAGGALFLWLTDANPGMWGSPRYSWLRSCPCPILDCSMCRGPGA